jgi:hypothetical protein
MAFSPKDRYYFYLTNEPLPQLLTVSVSFTWLLAHDYLHDGQMQYFILLQMK